MALSGTFQVRPGAGQSTVGLDFSGKLVMGSLRSPLRQDVVRMATSGTALPTSGQRVDTPSAAVLSAAETVVLHAARRTLLRASMVHLGGWGSLLAAKSRSRRRQSREKNYLFRDIWQRFFL